MYIVFDSNIWLSEYGLNTVKGSAVRLFMKKNNIQLALPEIVKEEVERNLRNDLLTSISGIERSYRELLSVFRRLKEIVLPNEDEIERVISEIFDHHGLDIVPVPFTIESARESLQKINDKVAPSANNQQFKDGVIWANCMELLDVDDVMLVTADKAFYKNRDYSKGLADNLIREASTKRGKISLYSSISYVLEEIKSDIQIDTKELVGALMERAGKSVDNMLKNNEFVIDGEPEVNLRMYATEDSATIYLEFDVEFPCSSLVDGDIHSGKLRVNGEGFYDVDRNEFHNVRGKDKKLTYTDSDGEKKSIDYYLAVGSAVLGHRTIYHEVRHQI